MYNRKLKKLTKKSKIIKVDLPNDWTYGVELAKQLDYVKKTKKSVRCRVEKEWDYDWLKYSFPKWVQIWKEKNIEIKWNARQRSFFLKYVKPGV